MSDVCLRMRAPIAAAKPGTRVGSWTLLELLKSQGGVRLYRASGPRGTRVLQEVYSPLESRPALLRAIAGWQALEIPQAVPVEEVVIHGTSVFLVNPEIAAPVPSQAAIQDWPEQLAELVSHLLDSNHPLALEVLHEEYLHFGRQGQLLVWNPGWATLRNPGMAPALNVREGLRAYAALVEKLAGREPGGLPASLIWTVSRCQTRVAGAEYASFQELRQALSRRQVVRESKLEEEPLGPVTTLAPSGKGWLLTLAAGILLLSAGVWGMRPAPKFGAGMAFARDRKVEWRSLDGNATRSWKLEAPVAALASSGSKIVVSLQDKASVEIFEVDQKKPVHLDLPECPSGLVSTSDGKALLALCPSGRVARIDLHGPVPKPGNAVFGRDGLAGAAQIDGEEDMVLLHPSLGLSRFGSSSKQASQSCLRSGLDSLASSGGLLWASSSAQRKLYQFNAELREESAVSLPGGPGQTRLYANPYSREMWSVHQIGLVGLWKLPETRLLRKCTLSSEATCVAADPSGHLWILNERGQLLSLDCKTWDLETHASGLPKASAIAFVTARI